jgi:hypothetical protein
MLDRSSCTSVRRSVAAVFVHENYSSYTLENDIALLRVSHCIELRLKLIIKRHRAVEVMSLHRTDLLGELLVAQLVIKYSSNTLETDIPLLKICYCLKQSFWGLISRCAGQEIPSLL